MIRDCEKELKESGIVIKRRAGGLFWMGNTGEGTKVLECKTKWGGREFSVL